MAIASSTDDNPAGLTVVQIGNLSADGDGMYRMEPAAALAEVAGVDVYVVHYLSRWRDEPLYENAAAVTQFEDFVGCACRASCERAGGRDQSRSKPKPQVPLRAALRVRVTLRAQPSRDQCGAW